MKEGSCTEQITSWGNLSHRNVLPLFAPSPVLHLLLYTRPGVVLGVPEDQLRAEDGGDAGGGGDLQRHYPPDALLAAGWIQQSSVPYRHIR